MEYNIVYIMAFFSEFSEVFKIKFFELQISSFIEPELQTSILRDDRQLYFP
jgi:hypothetical protein